VGEALLVAAWLTPAPPGIVVGTVLYLVAPVTSPCALLLVEGFRLCRNDRSPPGRTGAQTWSAPATAARHRVARTAVAIWPRSPASYRGRCGRNLRGEEDASCLACDLRIRARCMGEKGAHRICYDCEDDGYAGAIDMGTPSPSGYGS
jgi:hypothetical protein